MIKPEDIAEVMGWVYEPNSISYPTYRRLNSTGSFRASFFNIEKNADQKIQFELKLNRELILALKEKFNG